MALQTSGPISLSDIATEQGVSTTNMSLRSMSSTAGLSTPDSITEFYGYGSYTNSHYYDLTASSGQSLVLQGSPSPFDLSGSQDVSVSMWVRQDQTTAANQILWDFSSNTGSSSNRFFLQYSASSNRLVVRLRTSAVNFDKEYNLVNNSSATGISSGSWTASNRGNVNGDGWCLLTVTYDASESLATNAFKLYWNATELTNVASYTSGSRGTSAVNYFVMGNNAHNYTTTAGAFDGGIDEVKVFLSVLTSGNVSSIYNSGTIADATNTYSTGLLTEWTFDTNVSDSNGEFATTVNNTGSRTAF